MMDVRFCDSNVILRQCDGLSLRYDSDLVSMTNCSGSYA